MPPKFSQNYPRHAAVPSGSRFRLMMYAIMGFLNSQERLRRTITGSQVESIATMLVSGQWTIAFNHLVEVFRNANRRSAFTVDARQAASQMLREISNMFFRR